MKPEKDSDFWKVLSDPKNKEFKKAIFLTVTRSVGVGVFVLGLVTALGYGFEGDVSAALQSSTISGLGLILAVKSVYDMNDLKYK